MASIEHDRLGHVGHVARRRGRRPHARGAHRLRQARDARRAARRATCARVSLSSPQNTMASVAVAPAQQVLREIEARVGEPLRAGHAVAVDEHARALVRGDHATEIPHRFPELFRAVHAPIIEFRVGVEAEFPAPDRAARERGEIGLLDLRLAGRPHRLLRYCPRARRRRPTR